MKIDKAAQSVEQQQVVRERDASARRATRAAQLVEKQAVRERDASTRRVLGQPNLLNNSRQSGNEMPLPGEGLASGELGSKPCTLWMRWRGWWYTHWVPCHIGAHTAMHSALSTKKNAPLCVAAVARCLG
jgi:hypothetical protein